MGVERNEVTSLDSMISKVAGASRSVSPQW
jgi:hypothetical protein